MKSSRSGHVAPLQLGIGRQKRLLPLTNLQDLVPDRLSQKPKVATDLQPEGYTFSINPVNSTRSHQGFARFPSIPLRKATAETDGLLHKVLALVAGLGGGLLPKTLGANNCLPDSLLVTNLHHTIDA